MKLVLATTGLAVAVLLSPAFAQEAQQKSDGSVKVEGVPPSKVLGAIDTSKLADDPQPAAQGSTTTTITTIQPAPDQSDLVNIPSVRVPLPSEVASVASKGNGKYSTKDLVNAQLQAANNAPPLQQPVITTTTITQPDASSNQADQARTAATSDLPAPQPTPGGF